MKFPKLTAQVVAGAQLTLEQRIRRLEDALAHACSAIDDQAWDGIVSQAALRPLADFFLEVERERELEAKISTAEIEETVRTISGDFPR